MATHTNQQYIPRDQVDSASPCDATPLNSKVSQFTRLSQFVDEISEPAPMPRAPKGCVSLPYFQSHVRFTRLSQSVSGWSSAERLESVCDIHACVHVHGSNRVVRTTPLQEHAKTRPQYAQVHADSGVQSVNVATNSRGSRLHASTCRAVECLGWCSRRCNNQLYAVTVKLFITCQDM